MYSKKKLLSPINEIHVSIFKFGIISLNTKLSILPDIKEI